MSKPKILIDDREGDGHALIFSESVDTEIVHLPVGDYSLAGHTDRVAIERKSLDDLANCCGQERERFKEQIARLAQFQIRALVIEGDVDDILHGWYESKIRPLSVLGTCLSIAHWHNVQVWPASAPPVAAILVERLLMMVLKKETA